MREMKEFNRRMKPQIIILKEPRISGETADMVAEDWGKAIGFDWTRRVSVEESGASGMKKWLQLNSGMAIGTFYILQFLHPRGESGKSPQCMLRLMPARGTACGGDG